VSEPGPQPAEAAVAAAVRGVRVAAAQLAQPLGAAGFAFAAAQALPSVVEPALEALQPSPFSVLFGMTPADAARPSGPNAPRRRTPRSAPSPSRPAAAAGAGAAAPVTAASALAELVRDAASVAREAVIRAASTAVRPAGQMPLGGLGALLGGRQAPAGIGSILAGPAAAPPSGTILSPVVDEVFAAGESALGTMASAMGAVAPPAAAALQELQRLVAAAEFGVGMSRFAAEAPQGAHGPASRSGHGAGAGAAAPVGTFGTGPAGPRAPSGPGAESASQPAEPAAPVAEPPAAQRDALRRSLLAPTGDSAAADRGSLATAAPPERDDLAWLVNEALVEQARRHGVDLS